MVILEEGSYEKDVLFYVNLGEPQMVGGKVLLYFGIFYFFSHKFIIVSFRFDSIRSVFLLYIYFFFVFFFYFLFCSFYSDSSSWYSCFIILILNQSLSKLAWNRKKAPQLRECFESVVGVNREREKQTETKRNQKE